MKEELCKKVVKKKMVSNRVMAIVFVYEEDVLRQYFGYAPQSKRCLREKECLNSVLKNV